VAHSSTLLCGGASTLFYGDLFSILCLEQFT
jgi:hypothetical protein